jgi:hypothetical protein
MLVLAAAVAAKEKKNSSQKKGSPAKKRSPAKPCPKKSPPHPKKSPKPSKKSPLKSPQRKSPRPLKGGTTARLPTKRQLKEGKAPTIAHKVCKAVARGMALKATLEKAHKESLPEESPTSSSKGKHFTIVDDKCISTAYCNISEDAEKFCKRPISSWLKLADRQGQQSQSHGVGTSKFRLLSLLLKHITSS